MAAAHAAWLVYGGMIKKTTKTMQAFAAELIQNRHEHPSGRRHLFWRTLMNAQDPETG
jgi:hypothetical protein